MHFRDLSTPTDSTTPPLDYNRAAQFIIEQQFAPDCPATSLNHLVDCSDLVPSRFKTPAEFHRAVALRKKWCSQFGYGGCAVEALDGDADQNGLRFRFRNGSVASLFNLLHGAWGTRSSKGRS